MSNDDFKNFARDLVTAQIEGMAISRAVERAFRGLCACNQPNRFCPLHAKNLYVLEHDIYACDCQACRDEWRDKLADEAIQDSIDS